MCERCKELEETIAELEKALDGAVWVTDREAHAIARALKITNGPAHMLAALSKTRGTYVTMAALDTMVPLFACSTRNDPDHRTLTTYRQWTLNLRNQFGRDFIETRMGRGGGVQLSTEALAMIDAACAI